MVLPQDAQRGPLCVPQLPRLLADLRLGERGWVEVRSEPAAESSALFAGESWDFDHVARSSSAAASQSGLCVVRRTWGAHI